MQYKIVNGERIAITEKEAEASKTAVPPEVRIWELKQQLQYTDYKALKYMEGWLTDEEYAPIKAERQAIRDRINELEQMILNKEAHDGIL